LRVFSCVVWGAVSGFVAVRLRSHHDPAATAKANAGTNLMNDLLLSFMACPTIFVTGRISCSHVDFGLLILLSFSIAVSPRHLFAEGSRYRSFRCTKYKKHPCVSSQANACYEKLFSDGPTRDCHTDRPVKSHELSGDRNDGRRLCFAVCIVG
jgi:hypothetical protein